MNIVEKEPPLPSEWRPELDREVDRIVMRMLRKAPDKRYPNWADLAFDLAEIGRFSVYVKEISDREKFTALRGFEPMEKLNDAEIWELVHASYWVRVPAQTTIMKEGDTGAELLFLASGEVKVVKQGRLLNVLRTGSYFGEMAHVKAGPIPRQATVETLTDALIAEFRPGAMKKLSHQLPAAAVAIAAEYRGGPARLRRRAHRARLDYWCPIFRAPPPSTSRSTPVMKFASSEARNSAAFATSQAVPILLAQRHARVAHRGDFGAALAGLARARVHRHRRVHQAGQDDVGADAVVGVLDRELLGDRRSSPPWWPCRRRRDSSRARRARKSSGSRRTSARASPAARACRPSPRRAG